MHEDKIVKLSQDFLELEGEVHGWVMWTQYESERVTRWTEATSVVEW